MWSDKSESERTAQRLIKASVTRLRTRLSIRCACSLEEVMVVTKAKRPVYHRNLAS